MCGQDKREISVISVIPTKDYCRNPRDAKRLTVMTLHDAASVTLSVMHPPET